MMPSLPRASLISAAVIALPLSLIAARGRPRFCMACDRPCAMVSALSARYHCRWQASRAIVEYAEQDRRAPFAARRQNLSGSVVAIPMPECVDVLGLEATHLARLEPRRSRQRA